MPSNINLYIIKENVCGWSFTSKTLQAAFIIFKIAQYIECQIT